LFFIDLYLLYWNDPLSLYLLWSADLRWRRSESYGSNTSSFWSRSPVFSPAFYFFELFIWITVSCSIGYIMCVNVRPSLGLLLSSTPTPRVKIYQFSECPRSHSYTHIQVTDCFKRYVALKNQSLFWYPKKILMRNSFPKLLEVAYGIITD